METNKKAPAGKQRATEQGKDTKLFQYFLATVIFFV